MANKTIKGLTVEIGGDTTKLGKALQDVETRSRDLSGELAQINKLLKLDPGNTTLIAQKQKVLAEAVETTAEKLKTLKAAEKQVQAQFKRGEVSEAQVRALQREIIDTEKEMERYKKEIKSTTTSLKKMDKSTEKAEKSTDGFGSKMAGVAKGGLAALAAGVAALVAGLIASAEASREYRTEMGKLDSAFAANGHSAKTAESTYKTLQSVIGETDQSVEAAQQISLLAESEQDAAKWADLAAGVVGQFGDALQPETFYEAANETLKLGEATGAYTQMLEGTGLSVEEFNAGLAACNTEAEKQAYMLQVTDKALGAAGKRYKEVNGDIMRANAANEEWASAVADVGAEVEPLLTDVKLMGASLVKDLVPGIKEVAGAFRAMLDGDESGAANMGEALSGIITQILNKTAELVPKIAEVAVSLIATLATSIIHAIPQLIDTVTQVALTLVQGITDAIPQLTAALTSALPHIVQAGVNLFLGLAQAIPQVIPPLMAAIPQIVTTVVDALMVALPQLIQGAVDFLMAIVQAIPLIIPPLVAAIPQIVTSVVNGLLTALPVLIEGAVQLLMAIIDAIPLIIPPLVEAIPQIVTTIVDGLIEAVPMLVDGAVMLFMAIIDAIPIIIQALIPEIPTIIDTVIEQLTRMTPMLLEASVKLLMALVQAIPKVVWSLLQNLPQILTAITSVLSAIPRLIWGFFTKAVERVVQFGKDAGAKAKEGAKKIFDAVVNGIKNLPSKMLSIGKDLVKGLWNGIKDMVGWITGKLEGFGGSVLSGIKSFFGIKSPSRVFKNEVGKMLAVGLAEGIEDNASAPLDAVADLSKGMLSEAEELNGLTLERRLHHTFAEPNTATAESGLLGKLDRILAAIERGQIITLDGDALVGATANRMNSALGQRRVLAERGAV